jgi:hypothetical protein
VNTVTALLLLLLLSEGFLVFALPRYFMLRDQRFGNTFLSYLQGLEVIQPSGSLHITVLLLLVMVMMIIMIMTALYPPVPPIPVVFTVLLVMVMMVVMMIMIMTALYPPVPPIPVLFSRSLLYSSSQIGHVVCFNIFPVI